MTNTSEQPYQNPDGAGKSFADDDDEKKVPKYKQIFGTLCYQLQTLQLILTGLKTIASTSIMLFSWLLQLLVIRKK